ncbi:MAG: YHS domain-containing (seleno)protein [Pseudomonadales bacterium]
MKKSLIFAVLLSCASSISTAEVVSKSYWGDKAIGGHDTTAYYDAAVQRSHREVAGSKRYSVQWQGANWYFASQTSADKFAASPERYKPQYNGFCANALSLGEGLIPTDGTVWEFFGDQLHLFYAERGRERWLNGDWKRYQKEANTAWQQLKDS